MNEFWQGFATCYLMLGGVLGVCLLTYGAATGGANTARELAVTAFVAFVVCVLATVLWPAAMMIATGISIAEKRQEKGMR